MAIILNKPANQQGASVRRGPPVALPDADLTLEQLGQATCPKCGKELEWEAGDGQIVTEMGAVHPECKLIFVAVMKVWSVMVTDPYKNVLTHKGGRLMYPKPERPTAPRKPERRYVEAAHEFGNPERGGFLFVDRPIEAPVDEEDQQPGQQDDGGGAPDAALFPTDGSGQ